MKTALALLLLTASSVFAGTAAHFAIEAPPTVQHGVPFDVTVRALDSADAVVTDYAGTIDLAVGLNHVAAYTFGPADAGTHVFSITQEMTCPKRIAVSDEKGIKGETVVAVEGATGPVALRLRAYRWDNWGIVAKLPFNVVVEAVDASGNEVNADSVGDMTFAATCPISYLSHRCDPQCGNVWVLTLSNGGIQTITVNTRGSECSLSGSITLAVAVGPYGVTHFSIDLVPRTDTLRNIIDVTISARDDQNEIVTGYRGTVLIGTGVSNGPTGHDFSASDGGVFRFTFQPTEHTFIGPAMIAVRDWWFLWIEGRAWYDIYCVRAKTTITASGQNCGSGTMVLAGSCNGLPATTSAYWVSPTGEWSAGTGILGPWAQIKVTVPGVYRFRAQRIGWCGCDETYTVPPFFPTPSAEITAEAHLPAQSPRHTATVPATDGATYRWEITNGAIQSGADGPEVTFATADPGTTTLTATVTSKDGCPASATRVIQVDSRPTATIPETLSTCEHGTIRIPVSLTGTPPFAIEWSDGVVQSGLTTHTATREVDVTAPALLSILSLTDSIGRNGWQGRVALLVDTPPAIDVQLADAIVATGEPASFHVEAGGANLHYAWYFVPAEGPLMPVGSDAPTFATEWPVTKPETYLVRVSNACGSVDSVPATARPSLLRRRVSGS